MMIIFFLLAAILKVSLSVSDVSFQRFCNNVGGALTLQSQQQTTQLEGDKCAVQWKSYVENQKEAEMYCNNFNMYPVSKVEFVDENPVCHYENVYECKPSYTLIRGFCYRLMSPSFEGYAVGSKMCADEKIASVKPNSFIKSEILKLFDPALIKQLEEYFADLRLVFVQPTLNYFEKVAYMGDGKDYAIAYSTSSFYRVAHGSIIRMRKDRKAQVMCYYRAEETLLSYRHKFQKLAPFYHNGNLDGAKVIWRSAGHYSAKNYDQPDELSRVCENSMKAIVGPGQGGSWDPSVKEVAKLSDAMRNSLVIASSGIQTCDKTYQRYVGVADYPYVFFRTHYDSALLCRASKSTTNNDYDMRPLIAITMPTTVIFTSRKIDRLDLDVRPNAINAPLLCDLSIENRVRGKDCEKGWARYVRSNGITVCHKVISGNYNYDEARTKCRKLGGTLSTVTDNDEWKLVSGLVDKSSSNSAWLGLMKKRDCPHITMGRCSASEIYSFTEDLYGEDNPKTREFLAKLWYDGEANNRGGNEFCIQRYAFADVHNGIDRRMNDLSCYEKQQIICMKEGHS